MAEARTADQPLLGSKFKLRLIGTVQPLLSPVHDAITCNFATKEIKDYYNVNQDGVLMR